MRPTASLLPFGQWVCDKSREILKHRRCFSLSCYSIDYLPLIGGASPGLVRFVFLLFKTPTVFPFCRHSIRSVGLRRVSCSFDKSPRMASVLLCDLWANSLTCFFKRIGRLVVSHRSLRFAQMFFLAYNFPHAKDPCSSVALAAHQNQAVGSGARVNDP